MYNTELLEYSSIATQVHVSVRDRLAAFGQIRDKSGERVRTHIVCFLFVATWFYWARFAVLGYLAYKRRREGEAEEEKKGMSYSLDI